MRAADSSALTREQHGDVRVLYLARHGQGQHNVVRDAVGAEAWEGKISRQREYNGVTFAPDPPLSEKGEGDADRIAAAWRAEHDAGLAIPESFYASPMQRACQTLQRTWRELVPDVSALIIEGLRERLGVNLCDARSAKSVIAERFPTFRFEPGFVEADELFEPDHRETFDEMDTRLRAALNSIIARDDARFISITAHDEAINSICRVIGHVPRYLQPGEMLTVVVAIRRS